MFDYQLADFSVTLVLLQLIILPFISNNLNKFEVFTDSLITIPIYINITKIIELNLDISSQPSVIIHVFLIPSSRIFRSSTL